VPEGSDDELDYNLAINNLEIFSLYSVGVMCKIYKQKQLKEIS